jgi:hypothetical protein
MLYHSYTSTTSHSLYWNIQYLNKNVKSGKRILCSAARESAKSKIADTLFNNSFIGYQKYLESTSSSSSTTTTTSLLV